MFVSKLKNYASAAAALPFLFWASTLRAQQDVNSALANTPIGEEALQLRVMILYVLIVIGLIVVGVMVYSTLRYRKSKTGETKRFHRSAIVELIWIIIPILILVALALPASKALIQRKKTPDSGMTTEATGYRWQLPGTENPTGTINQTRGQT